ncbi:hypothetical protein [Tardiphaga robiniae]|uniref:HNH endonuclease n=1 Tax=Tardiphaga robiniae TaxID=943830 RepID=A0A7G6TZC1_9BRAD|nr:hypothetical protein [Tardiphaga robiniae]QND72103.1 HNH endonuclease [Tardiphaga robiniae]
MGNTFAIKDRAPVTRRQPRERCIYCDSSRYREKDTRNLGDEHIIAEGLGGTLVLEQAACEACERGINSFEQSILKTVLYAPRIHLGIRRKRRKRGQETIKVQGNVAGKEISVTLPVKNIPVLLFLLILGPPGILVGRPSDIADTRGAWFKQLSSGSPIPIGFESFSSPILDTFKFCQFLAKIAHGYAVDVLGDEFTPTLLELIRTEATTARYDLVGGLSGTGEPSENLHELELNWETNNGINYAVVTIRLFASLGAPTYLVVAGTAKPANFP